MTGRSVPSPFTAPAAAAGVRRGLAALRRELAALRRGLAALRRGLAGLALMAGLALTGCGSGGTNQSSESSAVSQKSRATSAAALIDTGIAEANARRYQQAQTTFNDVLVLDASNKYAWYNLGLIAQVQNLPSQALADYSKAMSADPRYTPAMYNKAILLERSDMRAALALYQRITAINPKAATAYLRESFAYDRVGDKTKAHAARARAIALDARLATITASGHTSK